MKRFKTTFLAVLAATVATAQDGPSGTNRWKPLDGFEYKVEMQLSASNDKTPLCLNANKYGLSSLEGTNGYLRAAVERPLSTDEDRKWGIGYGLDVAVPFNYTSKFIVQQAYAEVRWLHGALTVGAKEWPMNLKNNELSSGSQTLGKNARPVPEVRLSLADYWTIPFTKGWLHLKGHIAYGRMTDDNWQHSFTNRQSKYADKVLYHSKSGFLKIGNPSIFSPWSVELGLEMACTFGGTSYKPGPDGMQKIENRQRFKDFIRAFIPGGSDVVEEGTVYQNEAGNQLGSWMARVSYDGDWWSLGVYADKYFEDHSSMLMLDYDGYGQGENWNTHERRRYFLYSLKDWLLGIEYNYKPDNWLNSIVLEYVYTKYQSGPLYHDHSQGRSDHISGIDDFYNHYIFTGWQHWGQVIGNPLYRSPIYNTDGQINVQDSRFVAWHLGLSGHPTGQFSYRLLATMQTGYGTYHRPYDKKHHNVSVLGEGKYVINSRHKWLNNTSVTIGYGMDFGSILGGTNYGAQITITKKGLFKNED